jgi:hypothetical protein
LHVAQLVGGALRRRQPEAQLVRLVRSERQLALQRLAIRLG